MDTNTQILQELVEAVNSPDWWTIGITVVNALIMVWLGVKQNKLQTQQNKLARYSENKQLLFIIRDINSNAGRIIMDIQRKIYLLKDNSTYFQDQCELWKKRMQDFIDNSEDLRLKIGMTKDEYNAYMVVFMFSDLVLYLLIEYYEEGYIDIEELDRMPYIKSFDNDEYIRYIIGFVKVEKEKEITDALKSLDKAICDLKKCSLVKRLEKLCTL